MKAKLLITDHRLLITILAIFALLPSSFILASTKPNILFIFTDDQSHETVHAYGNDDIITPHMDSLVNDGVSFTNAYNMGSWSGAICIASRTMINTGMSVWRAKEIYKNLQPRAEQQLFWSQLLAKAGYETYMTGKWHVKIKPEDIFDHVLHERPGMPKQTD